MVQIGSLILKRKKLGRKKKSSVIESQLNGRLEEGRMLHFVEFMGKLESNSSFTGSD